ncbi:MAG: transcription antitermination factor NusB [Bacteroidia bacterium]|jgi:transcription antitermination protein NusB|nr:transcription antitermination factor NusB [Bacteroidia bacterium]
MLSRRHLRIRVMQALYTWYQSEDKNIGTSVNEIFRGTERTYDLYLSLLQILPELAEEERKYYADLQPRFIPKDEPVLSSMANNHFVIWLSTFSDFNDALKKRKISWQKDAELVAKVFYQLRNSPEYKKYVSVATHSIEEDVEFCTWVYKHIVVASEALQNVMEEQNIWWAEALDLINSMVLKTIKVAHPDKKGHFELLSLFRDEEDDMEFMEKLFRKTIENDAYFETLIGEKTQNWDLERIALIDIILLKMALSEILHFPGIPVKVSINEYIDISKDYSTPKSKIFINGVIDNIVADLKTKGSIAKTGRGLLE